MRDYRICDPAKNRDAQRLRITVTVVSTLKNKTCSEPLNETMVEIWQADQNGKYDDNYDDSTAVCRGKMRTNATGQITFTTVRPGKYEVGPGALRPAHIHFKASKKGYKTLITQMYFRDDTNNSPNDPCGFCRSDAQELMTDISKQGKGEWTIVLRKSKGYRGSKRFVRYMEWCDDLKEAKKGTRKQLRSCRNVRQRCLTRKC
jgi:protocatechuate 3,4-dioxygenase beta subunit